MQAAVKVTQGRAREAEKLARKKRQAREPVSPFLPNLISPGCEMRMKQ